MLAPLSSFRSAVLMAAAAAALGCGGGGGGGTQCTAGRIVCDGACVDPMSDPDHCGAGAGCSGGDVCGEGSFCDHGSCWSVCGSGQAFCGGTCVDPATNRGFCGASGLCAGVAAGAACAPDQVCRTGACACPEGQTRCDGACRFGACGAERPDFEWKASVPLTAPPRFPEPGTVLAHIVFDGTDMVDSTNHTAWVRVGAPPSHRSGMWTPPQFAAGPFTESDYWVGDAATRDYLRTATAGLFTACVRYKPGQLPISGRSKVIFALGKAEADYGSPTPRGGWALMETHESAGFHYIDGQRGEWMLPNGYPVDASSLPAEEWAWFCAGVTGDPADADLASQRESQANVTKAPVTGTLPLQVAPVVGGFPGDIDLPAIGNYADGSHPLGDGMVYEILVTADPATPRNMARVIALAEGGMLRFVETPALLAGADGATHVGPPTTVRVEPDGSMRAAQNVVLEPQLPPSFDPAAHGQCWGVEASTDDWSDVSITGPVLDWTGAGSTQPQIGSLELYWTAGTLCLHAIGEGWECGGHDVLAPGSRHVIQGCIAPDRTLSVYLDGARISPGTRTLPDETWIPHLEDPDSTFTLWPVSPRVKLWRVWACEGADPAACV